LLETIDRHSGCGTMEVLLEHEFAPEIEGDDKSDEKAWNLTKFVISGQVAILVRKGLATDDDNGWSITDRGKELLSKRKQRAIAK